MPRYELDYLVVGSGVAGLTFALEAAKSGRVAVITKRNTQDSATFHAQGGIASVLDQADSFESHVRDTLSAGGGLCHRDVVETTVRDAPARIRELQRIGVHFSQSPDGQHLDLGREGGHSARRIVHAGDITGREISRSLTDAAVNNENIFLFPNHLAVDLIIADLVGAPGPAWGPTSSTGPWARLGLSWLG